MAVELAVTSLSSQFDHELRKTFTPPYLLSSPLLLLHIPAALTPLSPLPHTGWRRGPVAIENGCHDNGAQL